MKTKKIITPNTQVSELSEKWSTRALRLIIPMSGIQGLTVLELYHWHWLNHGFSKRLGFTSAPNGIGRKTYDEIRYVLIRNHFPDLSDEMFCPKGTCPVCCPKALLEDVLAQWSKANPTKKILLSQKILKRFCDGH